MHVSLRSLVASLPLGISLLRFLGVDNPTSQLPLQDIAIIEKPQDPHVAGTRSYVLRFGTGIAAPDGYQRKVITINENYGGPLLFGNKSDRFNIAVGNKLYDRDVFQSTSVHWHGINQFLTNAEDGVGWVTQCPIVPGLFFEYYFPTNGQTGTYWWHSHVSTQYCDGLRGPLVIYDPQDPFLGMYNYDNETTIITLEDWHHTPALASFNGTTLFPNPDSVLINGKGRYAKLNDPNYRKNNKLSVINVQQNSTYRFRLINMSCLLSYNVTIDGHKFYVIESDGTATRPVLVDSLQIYIGQRYSIVVKADQPVNNYWFRANPSKNITNQNLVDDPGLNNAIFRYQGAPDIEPPASKNTSTRPLKESQLVPYNAPGADEIRKKTREWTINNASFTPPPLPVLLQILRGTRNAQDFLPKGVVYTLPMNTAIRVNIPDTNGIFDAHPFHLHGHSFDLIRPAGEYVENYSDPPRRDDGPSGVSFCFQTDNVGPWILHCHIDWHLSQGLAVVFAEAPYDIGRVRPRPDLEAVCKAFNESGLPPS
ncbi:Cu-oxidase-domain-containing protein [Sistotremastrum niveocremeum HHB9708]|uniref:Cu-oxidase-domain-containing protein n=1 Tax=Sistotremastrum niveocremeum HHB9708 TaxID=1314777 RepID=A0A164S3A9_9AGAM|nr:Cu-oxidase-domain-containing protein [Sistotremastrum niveocremeum HHB9708]